MTSAPENQPVGSASRGRTLGPLWAPMGSSYPVRRKPGPCQPLGLAYGFRPASSTGSGSPRSRKPQIMPGRIGPGERR